MINKHVISTGDTTTTTTTTTKQDFVVVWYPLEVLGDIDELQIGNNMTRKDNDNIADVIVDDDKRTFFRRGKTNTRVLYLWS